ncbi:MAG: hypothetical protein JXA15_02580 [Spirochaetales bacterium]|nr:hypothetical protein [Spirochaetales bacterium]
MARDADGTRVEGREGLRAAPVPSRVRPKSAVVALAALILAFPAVPAFGLGQREGPYDTVDALIEEQRYDEALSILADLARASPDDFDAIQSRIRHIMEKRYEYAKTAEEVVDVVINDPENQERKLALIEELKGIERSPNPIIRTTLRDIEITALFTQNRALFDRAMAEGRALIEDGRFVDAARRYASAFGLYREQFYEAGYDPLTVNAVQSWVDAANAAIDRSAALGSRTEDALAALSRAFARSDPSAIDTAWPAAESAVRLAASIRDDAADAGRSLRRQFDLLKASSPDLTDDSWLPFAWRLTLGRPEATWLEGVVGALDARVSRSLRELQTAAMDALDSGGAAADEAWAALDPSEAAVRYRALAELAGRAANAVGLWSAVAANDIDSGESGFGAAALAVAAPDWFAALHRRDSALAAARAADSRARALAVAREADAWAASDDGSADLAAALSAYGAFRSSIANELGAFDAEFDASFARAEDLVRRSALGLDSAGAELVQGALDARLLAARDELRSMAASVAAYAARRERDEFELRLAAAVARYDDSRPFVDGVAEELTGFLARYPSRAEPLLLDAESAIRALRAAAAEYLDRWAREPDFIGGAAEIALQLEAVRALDRTAQAALERVAEALAATRDLIARARSAKAEGDRRVAEARTALARDDFDGARERLEQAEARYRASLAFENDAALKAASEASLDRLGKDIVATEDARVVEQTRALITRARDAYYAGEFERAEQSLLSARVTWNRTRSGRNDEVESWLTIVQTALSIKTGRDIPVTAPLYAEMSQLLSLARRYFDEGAALLDRRDRVGALKAFDQARQKIQEVKVVFPLNQDARVLELRILLLVDPPAGNTRFAQLFTEARAKIAARGDLQAAYTDLLDLQAINPRYAGLAAEIQRVEILLGIRLPPPDPASVASARALVASARRIWDSRQVAQFDNAVAQLDAALKLVPSNDPRLGEVARLNDEATALKDRLNTYTGGTVTLILPPGGGELLEQAIALFTSGSFIEARGRLERLVAAYPQAARVPSYIDLDSRLSARGY